jgi:hypothetical protein
MKMGQTLIPGDGEGKACRLIVYTRQNQIPMSTRTNSAWQLGVLFEWRKALDLFANLSRALILLQDKRLVYSS